MPCGKLEEYNPSMNGMNEDHVIDDKVEDLLDVEEAICNDKEKAKEEILKYCLGHQKLMNQDQKLLKNELEIKKSKLKHGGLGLFSNVFIPKDNILSFYPIDILQDLEDPDTFYENGEKVKKEFTEENKRIIYNGDYNITMPPYRIIALEGKKENELYHGHFLNDRAYHPKKSYKPELNNCRYEALHIVSNRDIQKGEELYVTYGESYWFHKKEGIEYSRHEKIKNNY
jgi:SET domain-containing protein